MNIFKKILLLTLAPITISSIGWFPSTFSSNKKSTLNNDIPNDSPTNLDTVIPSGIRNMGTYNSIPVWQIILDYVYRNVQAQYRNVINDLTYTTIGSSSTVVSANTQSYSGSVTMTYTISSSMRTISSCFSTIVNATQEITTYTISDLIAPNSGATLTQKINFVSNIKTHFALELSDLNLNQIDFSASSVSRNTNGNEFYHVTLIPYTTSNYFLQDPYSFFIKTIIRTSFSTLFANNIPSAGVYAVTTTVNVTKILNSLKTYNPNFNTAYNAHPAWFSVTASGGDYYVSALPTQDTYSIESLKIIYTVSAVIDSVASINVNLTGDWITIGNYKCRFHMGVITLHLLWLISELDTVSGLAGNSQAAGGLKPAHLWVVGERFWDTGGYVAFSSDTYFDVYDSTQTNLLQRFDLTSLTPKLNVLSMDLIDSFDNIGINYDNTVRMTKIQTRYMWNPQRLLLTGHTASTFGTFSWIVCGNDTEVIGMIDGSGNYINLLPSTVWFTGKTPYDQHQYEPQT